MTRYVYASPFLQGNLHYYLEEENCNDQFSIIYEGGQKTAIMLNAASEAVVVEERPVSCIPGF